MAVENTTITVATFNIEKLGKNNAYQVGNAVKIIEQFDLVAIQEVMNFSDDKGKKALQAIVDALGSNWDSVISSEANGTESAAASSDNPSSFEYYAFIFRKDRITLIENSPHLWDEGATPDNSITDQERQFDREPFIASFETGQGNLDFTMISIHAASPSKTWRPAEIRRLKTVYESVQASDPNQNDVFLVGDFNTPVNKTEWDDLKGLDSMSHILTKDDKTTIYKVTGMLSKNQYDTFWYQSTATDEDILPDSGQVLMAWNVTLDLDPEKTPPDSITDEDAIKRWHYSRVMSDHLPVMIVLRTDQDTDHFVNN